MNDNLTLKSISANVGAIPALLRTREARAFFEGLGFTYLGPVDGHEEHLVAGLPAAPVAFQTPRAT